MLMFAANNCRQEFNRQTRIYAWTTGDCLKFEVLKYKLQAKQSSTWSLFDL